MWLIKFSGKYVKKELIGMSVKDQLRGLGGKEMKSEPFDLHVEIEVLQDVANSIAAGHLEFAIKNNIPYDDYELPVNKARIELQRLKEECRACKTKEDTDKIDKILDGYQANLAQLRSGASRGI